MNKLITDKINKLLDINEKIIIAIDGKCTSGKTSLASEFLKCYDCNVFHMDDFYLPFELRTDETMKKIGGNIDFERLINEVINNIKSDNGFKYGIFNCADGEISNYITVEPKKINIIEGVYCMHPYIKNIYNMKLFLDISEEEQLIRLKHRNPDKFDQFVNVWVPRENIYFDSMNINEEYDLIINADTFKTF